MPLQRGSGRGVINQNIAELKRGNVHAKTQAAHGKAVADKQSVAIAYAEARRTGRKK